MDAHAPGDRLPTTRQIAQDEGVGPVTVQRAIQALVAAGLVETRPGSGTFVTRRPLAAVARDTAWQAASLGPARPAVEGRMGSGIRPVGPDVIAMHTGYPASDLLPLDLATSALVRAARDPRAATAPAPNGLVELRDAFARDINAAAPEARLDRDDVIVTSGGQSALVTVFRSLARPGDVVVMESPTFWGAMAAATEAGLIIAPVATGPDGPDPDVLAETVAKHHAKLIYVQPTHANPTGRSWSQPVRSAVLELARAAGLFVVEDDWGRDLGHRGVPAPAPLVGADPEGHVVHVRSLTKSLSPSIRVAAIAAKGPALQRIRGTRWAADLYVSPVLQVAAVDVLSRPAWPRHLRRLAGSLADREAALRAALAEHAPGVALGPRPTGGLSLWVRLPSGADSREVAARCLTAGLAISPGDEWHPAEEPAPHVRLSYAATSVDNFGRAARILDAALGS